MKDYNIICFLAHFLMTDNVINLGKKNKYIKKFFLGVFPADINPYNKKNKTCCWIWNTDEDSEDGQHWIAIWIDNNEMIFFDSFGLKIKKYKRDYWINFANENNLKLNYYNNKFYQNIYTKTCGVWSLLFLYQKSYNKINNENKNFLSSYIQYDKKEPQLNLKTLENEKKLFSFANLIFKKQIKNIYMKKCKKHKNNQICKNFISLKI